MRHAIPVVAFASLALAAAATANPVSTTTSPRISTDTVAGVASITMGAMRGARELEELVPQVKVGDRWEVVPGKWVDAGPEFTADGGSGPMKYHPFAFAVPLRDGPVELRLASAPYGFHWTGERLEANDPDAAREAGEWRAVWPWEGEGRKVELPARTSTTPHSSIPWRGAGALALALGALLIGAGRRHPRPE